MSLNPPEQSYDRRTRDSLQRLLQNNLMVHQLMDYEKEKDYSLIQVPYEQKDLDSEQKIETRLNQLNNDLEKELLEFRMKFPTTPVEDKKTNSIGDRIRRSLFAAQSKDDSLWKREKGTSKRTRPSFACLILILILLAILITSLTLVLVFTVNSPHSHNPNNNTAQALSDPKYDSECGRLIICHNNGIPKRVNNECKCHCPSDLTGVDCRTLIVPSIRSSFN